MTTPDTVARISELLATFTFGDSFEDGALEGRLGLLDCIAYVSGKANPDNRAPRCMCPLVAVVASYASDYGDEQTHSELARRLLRLAGSNRGRMVTKERAAFLADFVFKMVAPAILRSETSYSPSFERDAMASLFETLPPLTVRANYLQCIRLARTLEDSELLANPLPLTTPLVCIVQQVQKADCLAAARSALALFRTFSLDVDILDVLDQLLNIGASPELPLTPKVQERIQSLSSVQATSTLPGVDALVS